MENAKGGKRARDVGGENEWGKPGKGTSGWLQTWKSKNTGKRGG